MAPLSPDQVSLTLNINLILIVDIIFMVIIMVIIMVIMMVSMMVIIMAHHDGDKGYLRLIVTRGKASSYFQTWSHQTSSQKSVLFYNNINN